MRDLIQLRTKELVVVGGAPGSGKSMIGVNLAMMINEPVLYIAQDTAPSVISRMAAIATGRDVKSIAKLLHNDALRDHLVGEVSKVRDTLILHQGAVTLDMVDHLVDALTEWLGKAPPVVIIDNLIDLMVEGTNSAETAFYATALTHLKQLALNRDCAIILLHHVTRSSENREDRHGEGQSPLRLTNLLYAGEREARHVWGVYNDGMESLFLQVLKQQDGVADPSGGLRVRLGWHPQGALVFDRR
jgi:KaiC/GvpD/RAD55 family RecA-like ATPase